MPYIFDRIVRSVEKIPFPKMADATPTIVLTIIVHIVAFADCRIKYFASLDFSPALKAMRIPISPKQDTIAVGLVPIGPPCHYVALNGCQLAYA